MGFPKLIGGNYDPLKENNSNKEIQSYKKRE